MWTSAGRGSRFHFAKQPHRNDLPVRYNEDRRERTPDIGHPFTVTSRRQVWNGSCRAAVWRNGSEGNKRDTRIAVGVSFVYRALPSFYFAKLPHRYALSVRYNKGFGVHTSDIGHPFTVTCHRDA